MRGRLTDISIGSLKTGAPRGPRRGILPPGIGIVSATPSERLQDIDIVAPLRDIPGIQPFLKKDFIPDLLYILETSGREGLINAISRADPNVPESIIFNHPSQEVNKQTQKVETELIRNEPEVVERDDIQCLNPNCKSRRIQLSPPIQTRSADEPGTVFARCVSCNVRWNFSAA